MWEYKDKDLISAREELSVEKGFVNEPVQSTSKKTKNGQSGQPYEQGLEMDSSIKKGTPDLKTLDEKIRSKVGEVLFYIRDQIKNQILTDPNAVEQNIKFIKGLPKQYKLKILDIGFPGDVEQYPTELKSMQETVEIRKGTDSDLEVLIFNHDSEKKKYSSKSHGWDNALNQLILAKIEKNSNISDQALVDKLTSSLRYTTQELKKTKSLMHILSVTYGVNESTIYAYKNRKGRIDESKLEHLLKLFSQTHYLPWCGENNKKMAFKEQLRNILEFDSNESEITSPVNASEIEALRTVNSEDREVNFEPLHSSSIANGPIINNEMAVLSKGQEKNKLAIKGVGENDSKKIRLLQNFFASYLSVALPKTLGVQKRISFFLLPYTAAYGAGIIGCIYTLLMIYHCKSGLAYVVNDPGKFFFHIFLLPGTIFIYLKFLIPDLIDQINSHKIKKSLVTTVFFLFTVILAVFQTINEHVARFLHEHQKLDCIKGVSTRHYPESVPEWDLFYYLMNATFIEICSLLLSLIGSLFASLVLFTLFIYTVSRIRLSNTVFISNLLVCIAYLIWIPFSAYSDWYHSNGELRLLESNSYLMIFGMLTIFQILLVFKKRLNIKTIFSPESLSIISLNLLSISSSVRLEEFLSLFETVSSYRLSTLILFEFYLGISFLFFCSYLSGIRSRNF